MAQGSGGYGGPDFSQIESSLRNIAVQFTSIVQIQLQLKASLDAWANLERELTLANAAANGTKQEFQQMEQAARSFAMVTTFSAGQVASSFYSLVSAGLNVQQTMAASSAVLLLAQGTLTDLGHASEITASSLAQFSLDAAEAYRVSNLFVASTNASLSTVPKLAFALRQVGPIAASAGLSIEQTVGTLDKLFDVGLRGEQAGTALRNSIARLQDPVGQAGLVLRAYGIQLTDSAGKARQWMDVMKDLSKVNITQAGLTQVFGLEAATGARAILDQMRKATADGTNALDAHIKAISNTDAAYRQAAAQMSTFSGQMAIATNHFNDFRISLGQALAPAVASLLGYVNSAVDSFNKLDTSQKLGKASTVLWGVELLVAAKGFGMLINGAASGAKAIVEFNKSYKEFQTAWAASASGPTGFGGSPFVAATTSAQKFLGVMASVAGSVVGLLGVVAAVYGIKKAIDETNDAAEKARVDAISKQTYQNYADKNKVQGGERSALLDQNDVSGQFRQQANSLNDMFPVNSDNGSGAFQRMRAYGVAIDQGSVEISALNKKIRAQQQEYKQFGEERTRLNDAIQSAYQTYSLNPLNSTIGIEQNIVQASSNGQQSAQRILQLAAQVTAGGPGSAKQSLVTYYNAIINDIKSSQTLSTMTKVELLQRAIPIRDNIITASSGTVDTIYNAFTKAQQDASATLGSGGASRGVTSLGFKSYAVSIQNFTTAFRDGVNGSLVLTKEQLDNLTADLKRQRDTIAGTVNNLTAAMPKMDQMIGKELIDFIIRNGNFSPDQLAHLRAALATQAARDALAQVTTEMEKNHLQLGDAAKLFGQKLGAARLGVADNFNKAVDVGLGAPEINIAELDKKFNEAHLQFLRQALRAAELAQQKDVIPKMQEITALSDKAATESSIDNFLQSLNAGNDTATGQKIAALKADPKARQYVADQLADYIKGDAAGKAAATRRLQQQLGAKTFDQSTLGDVDKALRTAAEQLAGTKQGNANALREYTNRVNTTVTPEEEIRKQLNGLPSQQQMAEQSQQIQLQAQTLLTDYLGMPLAAIAKAMETTQIEYQKKLVDLQNKNREYFTNTLTKGIDGAQGNKELQDAFSGKLIQDLITGGSADFNGTSYTSIDKLLDAITAQFSAVTARSPEHDLRVQKARGLLDSLAKDIGGTIDSFGQAMVVNRLKAFDAQTKVDQFIRNFNAQQMITDLSNALRTDALQGTHSLTLELAVNAQVGQVRLDSEQALAKMRESFSDFFKNKGIPVVFNPSTNQFEAVKDANVISNDPAVIAGKLFDTSSQTFARAVGDFAASRTNPTSQNATGVGNNPGNLVDSKFSRSQEGYTGSRASAGGKYMFAMFDTLQHGIEAQENLLKTYLNRGMDTPRAVLNRYSPADAPGNSEASFNNYLAYIRQHAGIGADQKVTVQNLSAFAAAMRGFETGTASGQRAPSRVTHKPTGAVDDAMRDAGLAVAPTSTTTSPAMRALNADEEAQRQALNDKYEAERKYWQKVEEFVKRPENAVISMASATEAAGKSFDDMQGKVFAATKTFNDLSKAAVDSRLSMINNMASLPGASPAAFGPALQQALKEQEIVTLQGQQNEELAKQERLRAQDIISAEQLATNEAKINAYYRDRISLAGQSIASRRAALNQAATNLQNGADADGKQNNADMFAGARAATYKFAAEIPTVFETASAVSMQAMQGLSGAIANVMTTGGKGVKNVIATMLSSMANLIANMLASYAVMQLIAILPGGRALLAAMDTAAKVSTVVSAGVAVGKAASAPTTRGPSNEYADGGVHSHAGRSLLMQGGIRTAGNSAMAIFGEGHYPEAFIPMIDRQTIPVHIDANGNPVVPLPSGETIPVTLQDNRKYYADGGVGGQRADNVIPYSKMLAKRADALVSGGSEAVSPQRGTGRAQPLSSNTYHTELGGIHLTIQGNASKDDADHITNTLADKVMKMLDARDAENARQSMRRGNTVQSGYYGNGGNF